MREYPYAERGSFPPFRADSNSRASLWCDVRPGNAAVDQELGGGDER